MGRKRTHTAVRKEYGASTPVQPLWAGWVMKGLIEEPINCRDVRPVSSPVTVLSHRGEFISSRPVDKSARTRRMPCIFKLFLSLLKYVLFGRVF